METTALSQSKIKWPEILSLAFLNAAIVISWIAYHEYQPELIRKFDFDGLFNFLIIAKAIILVIIPPLAGLLADYLLKTNGKFFTMFTVGIGATAMIFMIVASLIEIGPTSTIKPALPVMIVLWLVAMNLFISPANSMIDSFAPAQKLPLVVAFLFLITELIYSLEPVVVDLVHFFGDTLTFVVGGILISGSGFVFHKVSSNEVILRKQEMIDKGAKKVRPMAYAAIVMIGLQLGIGKAFLVEYFPYYLDLRFETEIADYLALGLLAFSAVFAFLFSLVIANYNLIKTIIIGFFAMLFGVLIIQVASSIAAYMLGGIITAVAFGTLNVIGLPFAFKNLSVRQVTYGVGIFIGASELFTGLFEYFLK